MEIDKFIQNFAETIEGLEDVSLEPTTEFRKIEGWDSLALLCTIAMIDTEYEVSLGSNEIIRCHTLQDLFNVIHQKSRC